MSKLSIMEQKIRTDINRAIETLIVHGLMRRVRAPSNRTEALHLELTGFGIDWPIIDRNMANDPIPGLGLISSPDPLCPKCKRHKPAGCKC